MKTGCARLCQLAWLVVLAGLCLATGASAQEDNSEMQLSKEPPQGKFVTLPPRLRYDIAPPATPLTTWNGTFSYKGKIYTYNMVGKAPSSNATTTIPVYIIPLEIVITSTTGTTKKFNPNHVLANGNTVTQNTVASPLFDSTTNYTQGGVNVGTTQYIDAFQRANFWGTVATNPNYHLLLGGPTVLSKQTLSPPTNKGKTGSPFGVKVGLVDIDWFDAQLLTLIGKFSKIKPNSLPIFLTYDVYLTQGGGCCIGGYHSAEGSAAGPQAYGHFTYIDHVGTFAQDVSALSHEIGEWADDPLVVNNGNNSPCGVLEVGDPLEGNANYGGYPYVLNGFTYNLQDLVTLPYFGAPASTSVNGYFTFQGERLGVCQNGS
ncbi:MAG: hypothetical protein WB952_12745 [Terriglobales bacterium]